MSKKFSEYHEVPRHVVYAEDTLKNVVTVTAEMKELSVNMNRLNPPLQHVLYLSIGTPVTFLDNTFKYLGVVNGTVGYIVDLIQGDDEDINSNPLSR